MDSGVKKMVQIQTVERLQRPADGLICNLLGSEITNISVTCDNQLVVEQLRELEGYCYCWCLLLQVSVFDFCAGLWGATLGGYRWSRRLVGRLIFERAVFGRREAELLRHLGFGLSLLVETQFPQQLIYLRAGHVRQGDALRRKHTCYKRTIKLCSKQKTLICDILIVQ